MTYFPARGQAPEAYDDDVMEVSSCPQEAALVWELQRLQRFLEEERVREHREFPRLVEARPRSQPPRHPRSDERIPSAKRVDGTVNRFLDRLGLSRRKPARGSGVHDRLRGNWRGKIRSSRSAHRLKKDLSRRRLRQPPRKRPTVGSEAKAVINFLDCRRSLWRIASEFRRQPRKILR